MAGPETGDCVELPVGTLVGKCENCGVVTGDDVEKTSTVATFACGHCGTELPKTKSLSKPLEVGTDALA